MEDLVRAKQFIRSKVRALKKKYTVDELKGISASAIEKLEALPVFRASQHIFVYWSMPDEVHTHDFIEKWCSEKNFYLPVVKSNFLELKLFHERKYIVKNPLFNVWEPEGDSLPTLDGIDLAIVPGMAFDRKGNRLGRGGGYYDRFLPDLKAHKIGLCFAFQVFETVPVNNFDIPMDELVYG
jgi:5-formyltetrahydrofolate cyclo-ligase